MRGALHAHPLILAFLGLDKPVDWPADVPYPQGIATKAAVIRVEDIDLTHESVVLEQETLIVGA